jgi:thiosulfate dehydrogenase
VATAVSVSLLGCRTETAEQHGATQAGRPAAAAFDPARWRPPADSEIPADSLGAAIRRGLALMTYTPDSLPAYAPGEMSCTNCHLEGGRNPSAAPLTGTFVRFPKYLERTGAVIGLADRINYCFTRSLAGSRLPVDSREMQDMIAYIAWLSRGVPVGEGDRIAGAGGLPPLPELAGDAGRGESLYTRWCASCHQVNGEGSRTLSPRVPPLWGPNSFSVGASMTRHSKAASFIWHNMPLNMGKALTHQQAYDIAAYVSSRPRLDSPGKEHDWPSGGAPGDTPYATAGHAASNPPPLLPRRNPASTLVPAPRKAGATRPAGTSR